MDLEKWARIDWHLSQHDWHKARPGKWHESQAKFHSRIAGLDFGLPYLIQKTIKKNLAAVTESISKNNALYARLAAMS